MFDDDIKARAYAQVLSSEPYGVPLYDPLGSDEVAIGDIGYVAGGRYHKLFTGAVPDTPARPYSRDKPTPKPTVISEKQGFDTLRPPEPVLYPRMIANTLPNWEDFMQWSLRYNLPREVNDGRPESYCKVEAGLSLIAAPQWSYITNQNTFVRIVSDNSSEWLGYAAKHLPDRVLEDGIILVTGFLRGTRDWDMSCKITNHPTLGSNEEFRAGCNCESIPHLRHNLKCQHPHPNAQGSKVFDQTLFLNYSKMKRRPAGMSSLRGRRRDLSQVIGRMHQSSKGYTELPGDEDADDDSDYDPETLFRHPVDWTLDYIFQTSPEADIAFVSDRQIYKICQTCDTQPLIQHTWRDEVRGRRWKTSNFYFFLQYHRPKVIVVDGVATIDTKSGNLFSFLCPVPLYKPLRTIYVYTRVRKSRLPRAIHPRHPPMSEFLEIRVVSPTEDRPSKEMVRESSRESVLRIRQV